MGNLEKVNVLLVAARVSLDDSWLFFRESFRLLAWSTPTHVQIRAFTGAIQSIPKNASGKQKSEVVKNALSRLCMDSPPPLQYEENVIKVATLLVLQWDETASKVSAEIRKRLPVLKDPTKVEADIRKAISGALRSGDLYLDEMRTLDYRLREDYDRYHSVITKDGLLDSLGEMALWMTDHPILAIGKNLLSEGLNRSDQTFVNDYCGRIDCLADLSNRRSQEVEDSLDRIVMRIIAESEKFGQVWFDRLRALGSAGVDVKPVLDDLFSSRKEGSHNSAFFEAVLTRLRDKRLIDIRSENRLRALFGIA